MIIHFDGKFIEKEKLRQPGVSDNLYNYNGVFETLRVYDGIPFQLSEHLERMNKSLDYFIMEKVDHKEIHGIVKKLLEENKLSSAKLKISLYIVPESGKQNILIEVSEYKPTIPSPASIMICVERLKHSEKNRLHKLINYRLNNTVFEKAKSLGFDEAIFVDDEGHILEGTRTNIFLVKDKSVFTPSLSCGVLPGITRKGIFEICHELKISITENILDVSELADCDEIFLTNSLAGVVMVKKINNKIYNQFSVTDKIKIKYKTRLHAETSHSF